MKDVGMKQINHLIERYPQLNEIKENIILSVEKIIEAYKNGNKIMVCGNGGSAADSLHIVGELMKAFVLPRKLPIDLKLKLEKN